MKKLVMLFAGLVVVLCVFYFLVLFFSKKNGHKAGLSVPAPTQPQRLLARPTPEKEFLPEAPEGVMFSYEAGVSVDLPQNLPSYTVVKHAGLLSTASLFANNVGLTSYSTRALDDTTVYLWNNQAQSLTLVVSPDLSTLSYQLKSPNVSASQMSFLSKEAVLDLLVAKSGLDLRVVSSVPVANPSGLVSGQSSGFVQHTHSYFRGDVPVVLGDFDPVSVSILTDEKGLVWSVSFVFAPSIVSEAPPLPLLRPEDILYSLNAGRGVFLYSFASLEDDFGADANFARVLISSVQPVYYFELQTEMLVPALLVSGTGLSDKDKRFVQYFMYASAE